MSRVPSVELLSTTRTFHCEEVRPVRCSAIRSSVSPSSCARLNVGMMTVTRGDIVVPSLPKNAGEEPEPELVFEARDRVAAQRARGDLAEVVDRRPEEISRNSEQVGNRGEVQR